MQPYGTMLPTSMSAGYSTANAMARAIASSVIESGKSVAVIGIVAGQRRYRRP